MVTPALRLDYRKRAPRCGTARLVLVAAVLAFVGEGVVEYQRLRTEVAAKEAELSREAHTDERRGKMPAHQPTAEELTFARDTIRRLATPWDRLFTALEAVQDDRVALLSVQPDLQARTVTITGEARDYLAALTYVGHLSEEPALRRVHLARHELRSAGERPVSFTVIGDWKYSR